MVMLQIVSLCPKPEDIEERIRGLGFEKDTDKWTYKDRAERIFLKEADTVNGCVIRIFTTKSEESGIYTREELESTQERIRAIGEVIKKRYGR